MSENFSRRTLLALTGGFLVSAKSMLAAPEAPASLDHILLGASDLEQGIAFVEKGTGVRAAAGGSHPGAGTRNALLSLGTQRYLEIIAPDLEQAAQANALHSNLASLVEPRLVGWASHTGDIAAVAKRLAVAGIAADGPNDGSRVRPDGKTLRWKTLRLEDDRGGLLPFFIEWSRDTVHPSVDAPHGERLGSLVMESPNVAELRDIFHKLGIEAPLRGGAKSRLLARIAGPRGSMEMTS